MKKESLEHIGTILAITASAISLIGALVNNLFLLHFEAMVFWMVSNPILCAWALGSSKGWWNGGVSTGALAIMYLVFTVSYFYGLVIS